MTKTFNLTALLTLKIEKSAPYKSSLPNVSIFYFTHCFFNDSSLPNRRVAGISVVVGKMSHF